MLIALIKTARPHQWVKNLFVLAPLIFARRVDDTTALLHAAAAIGVFCLLSSGIYILNDVVDVEKDRAHPSKRRRPIAAGTLPLPVARVATATASTTALAVSILIGRDFVLAAAAYFVLNLAYSFALKRVAFLDVACIASGFLLRVLGGAAAIAVPPSGWLLLCTFLLASLLGFGKRAHELRVAGDDPRQQREALGDYRPGALRVLLPLLAIATVTAYAAYTQSDHARSLFGTRGLALTIPLVGYGVLRFLRLVMRRDAPESPTDVMLRDWRFLATLTAYVAAIVAIIYGR